MTMFYGPRWSTREFVILFYDVLIKYTKLTSINYLITIQTRINVLWNAKVLELSKNIWTGNELFYLIHCLPS